MNQWRKHALQLLIIAGVFWIFPRMGYAKDIQETVLGHVEVRVSSGVWTYTVFNDEPAGSTKNINSFFFDGPRDYRVLSSPEGWSSDSAPPDGVLWENFESTIVKATTKGQIASGKSLSGFQIGTKVTPPTSHPYGLTSCLDRKCEKVATMLGTVTISPKDR